MARRNWRNLRLLFAIAVVLAALAFYACWWEPSSLTIVHRTIAISPWHREHSGLRVAVMSELHVGSPYKGIPSLKRLVSSVNAEQPDLVVLLGDYVIRGVLGGHFVPPEPIANELANLRAPLGVIAVLGNHDWWDAGAEVRHALESCGVRVLENEAVSVKYRQQSFWVGGLADLWTRGNGVAATLSQIHDNEPVLLLMHNPDAFPGIPVRVSLSLAGHTHGGQVNLPLIGRPNVPSKFGQRYAYGLIEESGRKMFVTSGVGTSVVPVRFRVPPEIVILEVRAAD